MTKDERQALQEEALFRAKNPLGSFTNFPAIINGFMAKGIPADEIKPRENVFTFNAWKALGRHVRKGEHGVRVLTFRHDEVETKETTEDGNKKTKVVSRPWTAIVFHVSQTDPIAEAKTA